MLGETELADLAADIKAEGLKFPIMLDATGEVLVDGRNRLAACKIAGVEPRFERLNGEDPERFIVSANVKRRNLVAQQRAIAAARAWYRAEEEGRVQPHGGDRRSSSENPNLIRDPAKHFAGLYGVSQDYVRMARAVLRFSAELADAVIRFGSTPTTSAAT